MTFLTESGRQRVAELAQSYGISRQAAEDMAVAVARGGGTMAQFNIPELGGSGQWMAGGMTMVGNMFDHQLQARVAGLCSDLANAMAAGGMIEERKMPGSVAWWPEDLGTPSSSGGQNQVRYAYFPSIHQIAVDPGNGRDLVLLDTGDHQIGGFGQQQSGDGDPYAGISFSSQFGQFALSSLPRVGATPGASREPSPAKAAERPRDQDANESVRAEPSAPAASSSPESSTTLNVGGDIVGTIERLAKLRDAGVLSEEEFKTKKTELLRRL